MLPPTPRLTNLRWHVDRLQRRRYQWMSKAPPVASREGGGRRREGSPTPVTAPVPPWLASDFCSSSTPATP